MKKHPLQIWREDNEVSRQEVADGVEVSYLTVGKWERGERTPRDPMKLKISKFTGGEVSPSDFIGSIAA